jgi:hypothetical protein
MTETSPPAGTELPSSKRLLQSMLVAVVVAALLLVTVVLPAQYGIDPTGAGRLMGLTALSSAGTRTIEITDVIGGNEVIRTVEIADAGEPTPLPNPAVFQQGAEPTHTETLRVPIGPNEETEVKVVMSVGKMILFSWEVDRGDIYSDYHGHDPALGSAFWVRYREQQASSRGDGSLVAPFDGEHGWYWVNYNEYPVVVTLTVTGFYDGLVDYGIF